MILLISPALDINLQNILAMTSDPRAAAIADKPFYQQMPEQHRNKMRNFAASLQQLMQQMQFLTQQGSPLATHARGPNCSIRSLQDFCNHYLLPHPWHTVSLDYITDLPSVQSFTTILVVVDFFHQDGQFHTLQEIAQYQRYSPTFSRSPLSLSWHGLGFGKHFTSY